MKDKLPPGFEPVYRISEVAKILNVGRGTVYKWLSSDAPEYAVIPKEGWFRLPVSGYIRIKESTIKKIQNGEL